MVLMFNMQMGAYNQNIDNWGHLGGLITGIIAGFAIAENDQRTREAKGCCEFLFNSTCANKLGMLALMIYFAMLFTIFFLAIKV